MISDTKELKNPDLPFLIALHSCTDTLGVAVVDCRDPAATKRSALFQVGRELSNNLFNCVETLLPVSAWSKLGRIAVATGPGGFTGTRITVVMARTLAQQNNCQLDGISSFALMAPRLASELPFSRREKPFWIVKSLARRGIIGGHYQLKPALDPSLKDDVLELEPPHLLEDGFNDSYVLNAVDDVAADVESLLDICFFSHRLGKKSDWASILPIYPTSPVGYSS